jgi:hypothetical protein
MRASRNPDGSFTYAGRRFRLVDRMDPSDTVDVIPEGTRAPVGTVRVLAASGTEPKMEVLPSPKEPDAVRAIAELLECARGLLPLQ